MKRYVIQLDTPEQVDQFRRHKATRLYDYRAEGNYSYSVWSSKPKVLAADLKEAIPSLTDEKINSFLGLEDPNTEKWVVILRKENDELGYAFPSVQSPMIMDKDGAIAMGEVQARLGKNPVIRRVSEAHKYVSEASSAGIRAELAKKK